MALKIYGMAQSRAMRPLWLARELGIPHELVETHFMKEAKQPAYLAINPNGKIPAIDDDGFRLWESMAINLYLVKKHGGPLAPAGLQEEGLVLQWSFWAMTELEPLLMTVLLHTQILPEDKRDPAQAEKAAKRLQAPLGVLEKHLAERPHLLGERFTVADLNVASVLVWARLARIDLAGTPKVAAWLKASMARPAFKG